MTTPCYYYNGQRDFGIGACLKLGIDISWPLSDKFAIGFYLNAGPNITYTPVSEYSYYVSSFYYTSVDFGFDVKAGILMLIGELNNRPFIIGVSPSFTGYNMTGGDGYLPLELRFGKVLGERFYITGNLNMGIPFYSPCAFMIEPGIALGWRLGKLK